MMRAIGLLSVSLLLGACNDLAPAGAPDDLESLLQRTAALGLTTNIDGLRREPVPDEQNAAAIYVQLGETEVSDAEMTLAEHTMEGDVNEHVLAALLELGPVYTLIAEAASKPFCVPKRDWDNPLEMTVPELVGVRKSARLLSYRIRARIQLGEISAAIGDFEALTALVEHTHAGEFAIDKLTHAAVGGIWADSLRRIVSKGDTLDRVLTIAKRTTSPDYRPTLGADIATTRKVIDQLEKGEITLRYLYSTLSPGDVDRGQDSWAEAALAKSARRIEAPLVGFYVELAEAWGDHAAIEETYARYRERFKDTESEPANAIAHLLIIDYAMFHEAELRALAYHRAHRVGAAAVFLRTKDGAWPTLDEAAELAETDQTDPFSGKPLVFRPDGEALLVHSVGPNGRDNGGVRRTGRNEDYDVGMFAIGK